MTLVRKSSTALLAFLLMAVIAITGSTPDVASSADHLDAPGLASPGGDPRLDLNDLFVFEGADSENTVLALTLNPVAAGDSSFIDRKSGSYHLRIDTNGDAVEDLTYGVEFKTKKDGTQTAKVRLAEGSAADSTRVRGDVVGQGAVNSTFELENGGRAFAGLRSDPFFFDLGGFLGTVEGIGDRQLGDGQASDFFEDLNTLAIVIEVDDDQLGDSIGVWATSTSRNNWTFTQTDRMGRAAINTVVNSSGPIVGAPSEAKNLYNAGQPKDDAATFTGAVVSALQAYSSLDSEGAYSTAQAEALAGVLLPDVITYDTSTPAAGPLNGRGLADEVIDIELRIVTGGDPLGLFADRDADGAINEDGVGPHTDYLTVFPYLGEPNS